MRTIKFKGKRIDNGEWIYGSYVPHYNFFGTIKDEMVDENGNLFEVAPSTVGQYTGLKDKNGKEIYEDDILLDESGAYAVVYYSMGSFCVDFGEGFDLQYFTDSIHEICYVAGNIHDNPELLKGGEQ
ncbi:YopX family protein [Alistipes dispar]|uniref:YopX family protein n=1 Tax=Alistipes dispar TaxID=2585119 RepID=UPI00248B72ED|nr:YopX family protein [Alistipes dispar]